MTLRRFEGWEPTRTTVYERDSRGRIMRAVTTVDPEWDDEQRGWMLALGVYEAMRCDGCGGNLAETTDPANEGRYRVTSRDRCHRCAAISNAAEQQQKSGEKRIHTMRFRTQYVPPRKPRAGG